jgi:bacterioferritin
MRHAERITERILFLEGLPNYQQLFPMRIGQTVKEQLEADLTVEREVVEQLRPRITMHRDKADITTASLFEDILASEEDHIDYLETNLELIDILGEQLYLSRLVERPPTTK